MFFLVVISTKHSAWRNPLRRSSTTPLPSSYPLYFPHGFAFPLYSFYLSSAIFLSYILNAPYCSQSSSYTRFSVLNSNDFAILLHLINLVFSNDTTFLLHSIYPYFPQRLTKHPLYLSAFTPKQFSHPLFNLLTLSPPHLLSLFSLPIIFYFLYFLAFVIVCYMAELWIKNALLLAIGKEKRATLSELPFRYS